MMFGVVDTTIIVHLFRRNPSALTWYASLFQPLAITPITWMEIMYGAAGKSGQAKCKAILSEFAADCNCQNTLSAPKSIFFQWLW